MSTTPFATAAGAARQRIATSLGTLQQDPNVPPAVLEIIAGLARAMGPLFQLERGNPDGSLFVQARAVLQETLAKMQQVDQGYPGVAPATEAIAQSLGTIFKAMRDGGLLPGAPAQAQPPPPPAQAVEASRRPSSPGMRATPPPPPARTSAPIAAPFAPSAPHPEDSPLPFSLGSPAAPRAGQPTPAMARLAPAPQQTGTAKEPAGSNKVPLGPKGLPRIEAEVGVHTETNFYTDFVGDIRNHGGIFVATFHVLALGSTCEVAMTFPGNLTAEIQGVVKWKRDGAAGSSLTSSPGLGVEITHCSADAWNLIDRFMRRREPILYEI